MNKFQEMCLVLFMVAILTTLNFIVVGYCRAEPAHTVLMAK